MNIGQKIKELRESSSMTQEELALKIDDTLDNIIKYESNEIEPSLDKKLAITTLFNVSLSELSYNIDKTRLYTRKDVESEVEVAPIEDVEETETPEVLEEIPFASSSTTYNEEVFNQIFKKEYNRYFIQSLIFGIAYILSGLFMISTMPIFAVLVFFFGGTSLLRVLLTYLNFKKSKTLWLTEHDGTTKEYHYYKDYLTVTTHSKNDDDGILTKYYYNQFVRVLELEEYMIAATSGPEQMLLVVDKNGFSIGSFIEVKPSFEGSMYSDLTKRESNVSKGSKAVNILCWVFLILSLGSLTLVDFIVSLFTTDVTIENQLLICFIAMLFPIASIVIGYISKKFYEKRSLKNIVVGIIILLVLAVNALGAVATYKQYTSSNDKELISEIEDITSVDIPDYCYTIYQEFDKNNTSYNGFEYDVHSFQILHFVKKDEVTKFENQIANYPNFKEVTDENKNQIIFNISDDVLNKLLFSGYELDNDVSHFITYNITTSTYNDLEVLDKAEYITLYYYEEANCMLVVEYTCNKLVE